MSKPFFQRVTHSIFVLFNFLIALFFLAGANARYFNPSSWWFIGFLTLSLPYLLVLLIIFIIYWIIVKSPWVMLPVIVILFGWRGIQNIIPFNLPSEFKMHKDSDAIRIMTWNVEQFEILQHKAHPELKQEMLDLINHYQPD